MGDKKNDDLDDLLWELECAISDAVDLGRWERTAAENVLEVFHKHQWHCNICGGLVNLKCASRPIIKPHSRAATKEPAPAKPYQPTGPEDRKPSL